MRVPSLASLQISPYRHVELLNRITDFGRGILLHKVPGAAQDVNFGAWKLDLKAVPLTVPKTRIVVCPKKEDRLIAKATQASLHLRKKMSALKYFSGELGVGNARSRRRIGLCVSCSLRPGQLPVH